MRTTDSHPDFSPLVAEVVENQVSVGENSFWVRYLPEIVRERLSGRHNLQAILGNSSWLFADKILRLGVGLVVGVWVARYLGPGRFGLLNYAIAFTSLFGALAALGLDGIVIRDLVKFPEQTEVTLGSAFALKLGGSALAFAITTIAIIVVRPGETLTLWLVALSAAGFFFQSLNVIDFYFQSQVQSRYTVYATNGAFLLMALARVGLLLAHAPLIAFGYAALGEIAFTGIFLAVAYQAKHLSVRRWKYSLQVMRKLLRESWPLILSGLSVMIAMRIDQIMIGQMLNDHAVGIYSAAARISELWYFIPLALSSSVFPSLVESKKLGENLYYQRLQKLYTVQVWLAISVATAMTFLSGPIVRLLYGHAYSDATTPLRILIWSGVAVSFGSAWSGWMLLENKARMMFYFQVTSAIVNVVLNLILIPRFGIIGSSYATLISYSFGHTILAAILKSQHKALLMLMKALFPIWSWFAPNSGEARP